MEDFLVFSNMVLQFRDNINKEKSIIIFKNKYCTVSVTAELKIFLILLKTIESWVKISEQDYFGTKPEKD